MTTLRGTMTAHPAVVAEANRPAGTRPELRRRDGIPIVVYRRTRVFVDRDAWEMLPEKGVLIMQVHPAGEQVYALAFTHPELERAFGHVRRTKSWDTVRHYHSPRAPAAVNAFRVTGVASTPTPATNTITTNAITTTAATTTTTPEMTDAPSTVT